MKRLKAKLHSCRGESLVEVLASILIATLSVGLLMGGVAVSAHLERQADQSDNSFYETLNAAEERQSPVARGNISVNETGKAPIEIPVQVYGGQGLWSYGLDASTSKGGGGT